jgi:hypothetical protein
MIDNLKTGVLKRILGQEPILNPKYLDSIGISIFIKQNQMGVV